MLSIEKVSHSGALIVRAFVRDGACVWLLSRTYYGHTRRDAARMYRAEVRDSGWALA